jgi:hypothetical protein
MILNWKQYLKFPTSQRRTGEGQALARVSHEGVSLMKQLLCEPEDRLGSQATASVSRPDSLIVQQRRSGFGPPPSVDGAELIKASSSVVATAFFSQHPIVSQAHPWFRGIDWQNIHKYPAPYMPGLAHPEDTRHFDDDIPAEVRRISFFLCVRCSWLWLSSLWLLRMVHLRTLPATLCCVISYMEKRSYTFEKLSPLQDSRTRAQERLVMSVQTRHSIHSQTRMGKPLKRNWTIL